VVPGEFWLEKLARLVRRDKRLPRRGIGPSTIGWLQVKHHVSDRFMFFKAGARTIPNHDNVVRTIMGMIYPTHLWWFWGYVCIEGCDTLCRWGSAQHRRYVKGWTYFTCYDEMDIPDIPEPGDFIKSTQKWLSHFNVPSASPTSTVRIQAPQSSASKQVTNQSIKNKRTNKRTNEQTNKQTKKQRTHVQNMFYYYVILTLSLSLCVYIYSIYPQLLM